MDKVSYALGLSIGQNFRASGFDEINFEDFLSGVRDVYNQSEPAMSYDEAKTIINKYFQEVQKKAVAQNKEAGEEFLKINAHKAGVTTLPSGLQYEVIKMGDGPKDRGETATFPLQGVIKGWTEILQLMPVGSKWKVTIPSDLAYGDRGAGQMIQPGSTLIFIIELIAIVNK